MLDTRDTSGRLSLDEEELVFDLFGLYAQRRCGGRPHGASRLLRKARCTSPRAERSLAVLLAYYERHRPT